MKLVKRGFVLTLAVLAAVFLLVTLRDRRQKISVYENRTLAAHPAFSVQSLWDGSYFDGWDNGERTDAPLLELPSEGEPVQYHAYMGGDKGETVIRTNHPELPNVLIVGDSFTNPVEALCTASFNELHSLDFRHYDAMTLTEYLAEYPADLVVVIRDNLNYIGAEANGDLSS